MLAPDRRLPANAKCVFKGFIFEVWQWKQTMYDGSTQIFEKIRRVDTVEIIPIVGDKILLQTEEQPDRPAPFLGFPGGRCDESDDALTEAKRELLEETGYVSNDWQLWFTHAPSGKILWNVFVFVARNCTLKQEPHLDAGERISTELISFEDFLLLSDSPKFRDRELISILLRARLDPAKREQIRRDLFG